MKAQPREDPCSSSTACSTCSTLIDKHALLVVFQGLDAAERRHHPPRDVRRQSAGLPRHLVQAAFPGGGRPRFSLAHPQSRAAVWRHWHFQSLALRRRAGGARPQSGAEGRLVASATTQINEFEAILAPTTSSIVKFFLHISKDEQKKGFMERIDDPDKRWKISRGRFQRTKILG